MKIKWVLLCVVVVVFRISWEELTFHLSVNKWQPEKHTVAQIYSALRLTLIYASHSK